MSWNRLLRIEGPGYRRKTLLLVSLFTALITVLYIGIFSMHIYRQKQITDRQRVQATAQLLSQVMRADLHAGSLRQLSETARYALDTFGVSRIRVSLPDGRVVMDTAHLPETETTAESAPITINGNLSPDQAIAQVVIPDQVTAPIALHRQTIGSVTVFSDGSELHRDVRRTMAALLITGMLLWGAVSAIGYMMMRRLTTSFDTLVEDIAAIEQGRRDQVRVDTDDEATAIGKAVNRMSAAILSREQARLIRTNKMSSLGLLVSCMGHEINNPNSIVRMQGEVVSHVLQDVKPLLEGLAERRELQLGGLPFPQAMQVLDESLESIYEQTERIDHVIADLREYAAGTGHEKEPVAVNLAIEGIVRLLRPQIRCYPGELEVIQDAPYPVISANKNGLQQVLINLLQNAFRATECRGTQGRVTVRAHCEGDWACLSVSDNGCGIHPDDISRVCDPFFSRHLGSGGTGLGLFITRQIVEEHDGTINFQSEPGKGTTVTIRLSAISGRGFEPAEAGPPAEPAGEQQLALPHPDILQVVQA